MARKKAGGARVKKAAASAAAAAPARRRTAGGGKRKRAKRIPVPAPCRGRAGAARVGFVVGCIDESSDVTNHPRPFHVPDCYKVCMGKKTQDDGTEDDCASFAPWCKCAAGARRLRVFGDVAAALQVRHENPQLSVDIVFPRQVNTARLQRNDMTFMLGYDGVSAQLDSTNDDSTMVTKREAEAFRAAISKPGSRVCPSVQMQKFGGCKRTYYQRAMDTGVPIAPTRFAATAKQRTPAALVALAKSQGWKHFVVKPAVGSWGDGVEDFDLRGSEARVLKALKEHLEVPAVSKSPDLIVQKCMPCFQTHPEVRCFWANGEFLYAVANWTRYGNWSETVQKAKVPPQYLEGAKRVGQMVIDRMLPEEPLGLVRTDIACQTLPGGSKRFFMNEVDLCPGWYAARYGDSVGSMAKVFGTAAEKVAARKAAAGPVAAGLPAKRAKKAAGSATSEEDAESAD